MSVPSQPSTWYDDHVSAVAEGYETLDPAMLHAWLDGLLPSAPALVLDVGAGTGRDASWLTGCGHDVVAVEPSAAMRAEGEHRHPGTNMRWVVDQLPALPVIHRLGLTFDLILLSGVWQHVAPGERERAMRKLLGLLRPGGVIALTLRYGPAEAERAMYPVSLAEVERLARGYGALVARVAEMPDQMARADVSWTGVALQLPDDGTGALPLLRYVILNDQKSATYKLGLLRALCRAADGQAGLADERDDDTVMLPLGLVALNWLQLYLPLVEAGLPQAPRNAGPDGLGFAGEGFRALLAGLVPRLDLRVGARFTGGPAQAMHAALQETADLIAKMPATYMTYPNGGPILPTVRRRASRMSAETVLDAAFLAGFGTLTVPRELWRALGRFSVWVEPALIAEWLRLMRGYAARQERVLDEGVLSTAMTWSEPVRDTVLPRAQAIALMQAGKPMHCVWSGRRLEIASLDIDHCLPWTAWPPCGDLWNLLPAHRRVNQHEKRDRLPTDELLRRAAAPIQEWWQLAYLGEAGPVLARRFADEARASLPGLGGTADIPAEVFAALRVQRLRLRHDQQVPEWSG